MKKQKENKKGRGKKALKVLCIILAVIVIAVGVCSVISAVGNKGHRELIEGFDTVSYPDDRLVPEKDADGDWVFTTDRDFKIVQLTDVHLGGGFMSIAKDKGALYAVERMLKAEQPDLVIVTGDVAYPVPFQAGTFNNKTGAELFAKLMDKLGIYWTVCFGNHDTEAYSYYSREDISDFYMNSGFEYCLFEKGPDDVDGFGNQVIKIKNTKGAITQALFIFDSHSYTGGDIFGILWKYDNIHENQVEWYKARLAAMNEYNASLDGKKTDEKTVKSLAFFHIPLVEFKDAWEEFAANGYKDTENVKYIEGMVGETGKAIFCGIGEDDLFEAFLEEGSTKAVFCGHDHLNNFTINYKGIDFSYGNSIDYLAYIGINEKGSQRGCTCITVSPDGTYKIDKYNLYRSGRYDMPAELKNVDFQFDGVEYQYFEEE